MILKNFPFQEEAVEKLSQKTIELLSLGKIEENGETSARRIVFKAPTGSGKTIMMGNFLKDLLTKRQEGWNPDCEYLFVWVSLNDLHIQSLRKISKIVGNSYKIQSLDTLNASPFEKNTLLFANWQALKTKKVNEFGLKEWANKSVRKTERGNDLGSLIEITKEKNAKNVEVILIIDEAHTHLSAQAEEFIKEIFDPTLIIEVTATPKKIPNEKEIHEDYTWGYISVPFKEVVKSGLIKQKTVINDDLDNYDKDGLTEIDILLEAAYQKRIHLLELYRKENLDINPLILIQLPSSNSSQASSEKSLQDAVESFFKEKGITRDNGKLAAWLSTDKENKENIEYNDNEAEVLIFKIAIAQGTDIPRANILVMLRDIASQTLEIQTVGRVLRMPEAKHYDNDELNTAYLYTSIDGLGIKDQEAMDFFSEHTVALKSSIANSNLILPSATSERLDRVQLDIRFEKILFRKLLQHFGIAYEERNEIPVILDSPEIVRQKIDSNPLNKTDNGLEIDLTELSRKTKVGIEIPNFDEVTKYIGNPPRTEVDIQSSLPMIQQHYWYLLRAWISPYLSARGAVKAHNSLKKFFAFAKIQENMMQRIISLSVTNQRILRELIELAKLDFVSLVEKETGGESKIFGENFFNLDKMLRVPHSYTQNLSYKKYAYEPCFMPKVNGKTFKTEEAFEENILEEKEDIVWWYKNPSSNNSSLGIRYSYNKPYNEKDKINGGYTEAIFRPDYIVMFNDGTIGIYDTKSFGTKDSEETKGKSNALRSYIKKLEALGIKADGGIVDAGNGAFRVFRGDSYSAQTTNSDWKDFSDRTTSVTKDNERTTPEVFLKKS